MLAHAFLTALAITEPPPTTPASAGQPAKTTLIALTRNEIRHLFAVLVTRPARSIGHRLAWSTWRRRHQHHARTSHYQQRSHTTP